jgi:hypothetical protein
MRSLSRHLALLPPISEVTTYWSMLPQGEQDASDPLNLLVVPYPYRISGQCFRTSSDKHAKWGLFDVEQGWIPATGAVASITHFLKDLIAQAQHEVDEVDGIVLPELALPRDVALEVARQLAHEEGLEFFISGVSSVGKKPRNQVLGCAYANGDLATLWLQSKHHRWKLDASQVATYSLGHVADGERSWWEDIDVGKREVQFFQVRNGACLTTLVCEDLARIDPVQPVIRAVGPNLVLALLMDGAQLRDRWPGRYATVLAEDPGCSVLTLTSLGMLLRSHDPNERPSRSVALWREPSGAARQLELGKDDHALLLTLSAVRRTESTMDGRTENATKTVEYRLAGLHRLRVNPEKHQAVLT